MATFYQANVTATSGSAFVTVNSSTDDIGILRERSFLQIGTNRIVEVKRGVAGSPDQIELAANWPFATVTADAIAGPTAGDLAEAVAQIRALNTQAAAILNDAAQLTADQVFTGLNRFSQGVRVGTATDTQITRGEAGQIDVAGSRVFQRNNILGTVSQSGGVPTGAIIERGSNANGEYTKFADGTMICRLGGFTLTPGAGNDWIGTWTFPVAFSLNPILMPPSLPTAGANWDSSGQRSNVSFTGDGGPSTTTGLIRAWALDNTPVGDIRNVQLMAVGRWF